MSKKIVLISLYDEFCIGMRYIASHCNAAGHETTIINLKRYSQQERETAPEDLGDGYLTLVCPRGDVYLDYSSKITPKEEEILFKILDEKKPDLVGFSVPSYHARIARQFTKEIRERYQIPIIWGGVHATVATKDCIENENPPDFVCVGEGEDIMLDLIDGLENNKNFEEEPIDGLCVLRKDGQYIYPKSRQPPADLDAIPYPQYDPLAEYLIEDDKTYHNEPMVFSQLHWTYKMVTGRGCPYFCSFCVWSTIKRDMPETKKLRRRSPQNAIAEIIEAKRKNPQLMMIEFEDDIFTVQKDWLEEFAPLYIKHVNLPFWCYTYPNFVNDHNLAILKEMGIDHITMGVQSGSDRINYEVFERRTERKRVQAAMQLIANHDIMAYYDIITNNPYENEEDRMETLTFIAEIPGRFGLHMGKLAWFPGTTITTRAEKEDMKGTADEKMYRFWNALYQMAYLKLATRDQLVEMTKDEHLRENPEVLWTMLKRFEEVEIQSRKAKEMETKISTFETENKALKQQLDSLNGRRVVKVGTAVADRIKSLVGTGA